MSAVLERELRRAILCERAAHVLMGELVADCPGDCMAHLLGWSGMYLGAARTAHGWRTPARGDLGAGWPDLTLIHPRQQRIIYAELKSETGRLKPEQLLILARLRAAGAEAYTWRPADLDSGAIWRRLQHGGKTWAG